MKFTKSKAEDLEVPSKRGLLRRLGSGVKKIFVKERKPSNTLLDKAAVNGSLPARILLAFSREHSPRDFALVEEGDATPGGAQTNKALVIEEILTSVKTLVALKEEEVVPDHPPRSQICPKTAVALIDLFAQGARILADGLHVGAKSATRAKPASTKDPRGILKRTSPPPALTLAPEGARADNTLTNNTPEPSPTFAKFVQIIEEYGEISPVCPQVLIIYLKLGAKAIDADWLAFIDWTKGWHQAEVEKLRSDLWLAESTLNARDNEVLDLSEELEDVNKERDEAVKEKRDREREATREKKKEIRKLYVEKVAMETKQLELQDQLVTQEKESQVEVGRLSRESGRRQTAIDNLCPMVEGYKSKLTNLANSFDVVKTNLDLEAKIQLLEKQNRDLNDQKNNVQTFLDNARLDIKELNSELQVARTEAKSAGLEVGPCHQINSDLRYALEDANSGKTAEADGLLEVKDKAYKELEKKATKYATAYNQELTTRAMESERFMGIIGGLRTELKDRHKAVDELTTSRDNFQHQSHQLLQMLKSKLWEDDIQRAIIEDSDTLRKDNALLISLVHDRKCLTLTASEQTAALKATIVELKSAAKAKDEEQSQLQADFNGLELRHNALENAFETDTQRSKQTQSDLKAKIKGQTGSIKQQEEKIQQMIADGSTGQAMRNVEAIDSEIAKLRADVDHWMRVASHHFNRTNEMRQAYCYFLPGQNEVDDWEAELNRQRHIIAERKVKELEEQLKSRDGRQRASGQDESQHEPCLTKIMFGGKAWEEGIDFAEVVGGEGVSETF